MPKRTDIKSILIIGAGPIVIGQACEFDYSGVQACKALREEGYKVILINSNPATIMTDPATADVTYIEPITWQTVEKIIAKERPDAILPTMGGQTALNCALDLWHNGVLEPVQGRADRRQPGGDRQGRGPPEVQGGHDQDRSGLGALGHCAQHGRGLGGAEDARLPDRDPAQLHARRHRRRHCLQRRRVRDHLQARPGGLADQRTADRRVAAGLERVRDGGGARQGGQLHHRVLDREPRPDGRAHRRLDHRGAGADADRQGIPDPAQRVAGRAARDRRRHRWLERAVRDQSGRRAHGRHRDESARLPLVGAGVQGDRFSDRQDRGQAGGRLHAGRTAQRDHRWRDAGQLRAQHRLRGDQDSAFCVREVSGCRLAPDDADEVGRRGDGHRPHLPGVVPEGPARTGGRRRRHEREDAGPRSAGEGTRRARSRAHLVRG